MEQQGIYAKYTVTKNEDGEVIKDCFVLRPGHDPNARLALYAYAMSVREENPSLAADIFGWLYHLPDIGVLEKTVPDGRRKFAVSGNHIEPSYSRVVFADDKDLFSSFADGDLEAAIKCMTSAGERLLFMVELVDMTDEQLAAIEPYDP